jgi:organic hydroperoxide reductase OsmC/OhrA
MSTMKVSLRNVPGTKAAMGWAGGHTIVIDRPEGRAGGMGLGFNGGQMIALAIGGCFCNDLRYAADEMGVELDAIEVDVSIELEGKPLLVTSATMSVRATGEEGVDVAEVIRRAEADSTVSNSVRAGFPVKVVVS